MIIIKYDPLIKFKLIFSLPVKAQLINTKKLFFLYYLNNNNNKINHKILDLLSFYSDKSHV